MKEKRILDVLGQVDERYIEEAAPLIGDSKMITLPSRHFRHRLPHAMVAVIAAVILLGCSVVAVMYGDSIQNWFSHYWEAITGQSMSEGQSNVIDHLSQEIGLSQTVGEVSVTVDSATVGDDSFFLLLRVDGMKFSKRYSYGFENVLMEVQPDPLENAGGMGSYGFQYQGMDGDGTALMLMDFDYMSSNGYEQDTRPLEVTLTLENLIRNAHTDKERQLAEGQWSFEFTIDRSNIPEVIALPDTEVTVMNLNERKEVMVPFTNIELTNTGVRFQYDYAEGTLDIVNRLSVVLKNGIEIDINGGVGTPTADESALNCSYHWAIPVDLDEVVALKIGETEIPVP